MVTEKEKLADEVIQAHRDGGGILDWAQFKAKQKKEKRGVDDLVYKIVRDFLIEKRLIIAHKNGTQLTEAGSEWISFEHEREEKERRRRQERVSYFTRNKWLWVLFVAIIVIVILVIFFEPIKNFISPYINTH
jgi:hypothetical protein